MHSSVTTETCLVACKGKKLIEETESEIIGAEERH